MIEQQSLRPEHLGLGKASHALFSELVCALMLLSLQDTEDLQTKGLYLPPVLTSEIWIHRQRQRFYLSSLCPSFSEQLKWINSFHSSIFHQTVVES